MVVTDPALVARRAAGRLDPPHQPGGGQRVQRLVDGLQGHVADPLAHPGGDGVGVQMVASAHGLQQGHARRGHPESGAAQLLGGGRRVRCGHGFNLSG